MIEDRKKKIKDGDEVITHAYAIGPDKPLNHDSEPQLTSTQSWLYGFSRFFFRGNGLLLGDRPIVYKSRIFWPLTRTGAQCRVSRLVKEQKSIYSRKAAVTPTLSRLLI